MRPPESSDQLNSSPCNLDFRGWRSGRVFWSKWRRNKSMRPREKNSRDEEALHMLQTEYNSHKINRKQKEAVKHRQQVCN